MHNISSLLQLRMKNSTRESVQKSHQLEKNSVALQSTNRCSIISLISSSIQQLFIKQQNSTFYQLFYTTIQDPRWVMGRNEVNQVSCRAIQKLTSNRFWRAEVSLLETTSSTSSKTTTPSTATSATATTTAATATITTSTAATSSTERHEYRTIDRQEDLKVTIDVCCCILTAWLQQKRGGGLVTIHCPLKARLLSSDN